jgi:alanine-glyoxylate transaminase/serine-glyoxylate transaminase/serine-pyruvate transaminase
MVLRALGGVEMAMRDAGIPFQAGSGVGAAVEYYTDTRQPLSLAAE